MSMGGLVVRFDGITDDTTHAVLYLSSDRLKPTDPPTCVTDVC